MWVPFQLSGFSSQVHYANHGTLIYPPDLKSVCFQCGRCQYVLFEGMPIDAGDTHTTPDVLAWLLAMPIGSNLPFYSSCDGPGRLSRCNHALSLLFLNSFLLDLLAEGNNGVEARQTLSVVDVKLRVPDVCKFARHLTVGQCLTAHIWTAAKEHFLYRIIKEW